MIQSNNLLSSLPQGLRNPLIEEYSSIVRNFMERRWSPSELSGGKFCEIVYTILEGHASGKFPNHPNKPRNFVEACRKLESMVISPRSFQILIPRLLPALYEIRNNRGVGHVGGDVNPNYMDASSVLSISSWVMAELIRVFHNVSIAEAQHAVDLIVERRIPIVWIDGTMRRVLKPELSLKDNIMLLIGTCSGDVEFEELFKWTDYQNKSHFSVTIKRLHKSRFLEFDGNNNKIKILPPGSKYVDELIQKFNIERN
jgi:hypothetical protein